MDSYRLYRVLINKLVCCCMTILPVDSCAPSLQQILSNYCSLIDIDLSTCQMCTSTHIHTHRRTCTRTRTRTQKRHTCLLKLFLFITQNELLNSQFMFRFWFIFQLFLFCFSVFLLDLLTTFMTLMRFQFLACGYVFACGFSLECVCSV